MNETPTLTRPWLASKDYGLKLLSPPSGPSTGYVFSKAATLNAWKDFECNHLETMMCAEVLEIRQCNEQIAEIDLAIMELLSLKNGDKK